MKRACSLKQESGRLFFKGGVMLAHNQDDGKEPVFRDFWKIKQRAGATSLATNLRIWAGMP